MYAVKFLGVMFATILVDIAWTLYFIRIGERKSLASGFWAVVIVLLGAFSTITWVHDTSFLLAVVIGSFIGTAGSVEWQKKTDDTRQV
jgi:hypothetical protein